MRVLGAAQSVASALAGPEDRLVGFASRAQVDEPVVHGQGIVVQNRHARILDPTPPRRQARLENSARQALPAVPNTRPGCHRRFIGPLCCTPDVESTQVGPDPDETARQLRIFEALLVAIERRHEVSDVAFSSADPFEAQAAVQSLLGIDHESAAAVIDMQVRRCNADSRTSIAHRVAELRARLPHAEPSGV